MPQRYRSVYSQITESSISRRCDLFGGIPNRYGVDVYALNEATRQRFLALSLLVHDVAAAYRRLYDLTIGTGGTLHRPVVRLASAHPYANGYRATEAGGDPTDFGDDGWPLNMAPGRHEVALCAVTGFGALQPRSLVYEVVDG